MFATLTKRAGKSAAAVAALCTMLAAPAFADKPAPKAEPPTAKVGGASKELAGLAPSELKTGNAGFEFKKKRGDAPTVAPSKDAIVAWFTALNVKHTVDENGRIIVPFRDEAAGINFNIFIMAVQKPSSGNVWAIRAVIPLMIPLPAGDSGLARALIFANNWNNEHFLNKVSMMQPGDKPFFLLDSTLVCEGGLNQADFINNFLVLLVQDGIGFVKKGVAELR